MDITYNSFLESCVKKGKIPMSFVRTPEFLQIIEDADIIKESPYEELFYSRDEDLNVNYTREGARYYYEDERIFDKESESTSICKQDIDLGEGYENYTFFSRSTYTNENVKGTKYVGLMHYEKNKNKKVDADMIVSRHTLIDCLYIFFNKSRFNHCVVYSDGQIFFESNRSVSTSINRATMTGYNFEEVVTHKTSNAEADFKFVPPINNAIKYNSMIMHNFPSINTKVLVSCEIDAIVEDPEKLKVECGDPYTFKRKILENYMELKTRSSSSVQKKTYLQCYLAGTKNLAIGLKDKDLNLKKLIKFDLSDIKNEILSMKILNKWFAFISQFIKLTIKRYSKRYKRGLYRMVIFPGEDVLKLYPYSLSQEEQDLAVIPKFLDWRKELKNLHISKVDDLSKHIQRTTISNTSVEQNGEKKKKKKKRVKKQLDNVKQQSTAFPNTSIEQNEQEKKMEKNEGKSQLHLGINTKE